VPVSGAALTSLDTEGFVSAFQKKYKVLEQQYGVHLCRIAPEKAHLAAEFEQKAEELGDMVVDLGAVFYGVASDLGFHCVLFVQQ